MNYSDFKKKLEDESSIPLKITNKIIKYGSTIYQLKNISHAEIVKKNVTEIKMIGNIGGMMFILGVPMFFASDIVLKIISIIIMLVGIFLLLRATKTHIFYGLVFETNSGAQNLFYVSDKSFMEKINIILSEALSEISPIDYDININDKKIIDNIRTTRAH